MDNGHNLKLSAAELDAALARAQNISNPNLLDNWYFGNPVNQRGGYVVKPGFPYYQVTEGYPYIGETDKYYTATIDDVGNPHFFINGVEYFINNVINPGGYVRGYTGDGYTIDRWLGPRITAVIRNNDLYLQQYDGVSLGFYQIIENGLSLLAGKTVTFSALVTENTGILQFGIQSEGYKVTAAGETGLVSYTATIPSGATGNAIVYFLKNDLNGFAVKAVKLELGSQQTLAHQDENGNWVLNEIPNYTEELAKCQRYFQRLDIFANYVASAYGSVNEQIRYIVPMRVIPVTTFSKNEGTFKDAPFVNRQTNQVMNVAFVANAGGEGGYWYGTCDLDANL